MCVCVLVDFLAQVLSLTPLTGNFSFVFCFFFVFFCLFFPLTVFSTNPWLKAFCHEITIV